MQPTGWLRRLADVCIARPLSALGMTRDQLSSLRIVVGLLAAGMIAIGPSWFPIAGAVFLCGILLARSDDALAILSDQTSPAHQRYAFISQSVANFAAFSALGVGMRSSEYGLKAIAMGLLAAAAAVVIPWLMSRLELADGKRSAEFNGISGVEAEDVVLLVPVALWVGWAQGLLIVTAFGGAAFASALYLTHYRKFTAH